MNQFKWVSSAATLVGALAISALPLWSQTGGPQGSGGGSATGQGSSGMSSQDQSPGGQSGQSGMSSGSQSGDASGTSRAGGTAARGEDVKKVQQALKEKGQDPGPIDGVMGPKTKQALTAFQQQQGLKATGTLDNDTKQALGIDQSGTSSRSSSGGSKSGAASSRPGGASSGAKGGSSYNEPAGADVNPAETGPSSKPGKQ